MERTMAGPTLMVSDRRAVVILVCSHCRSTVVLRRPEPSRRCTFCGSRCEVPDDGRTMPC